MKKLLLFLTHLKLNICTVHCDTVSEREVFCFSMPPTPVPHVSTEKCVIVVDTTNTDSAEGDVFNIETEHHESLILSNYISPSISSFYITTLVFI